MVSDSITNTSIPCAPNLKDLGKKKRVNRTAKLKQSKLDARRKQWLSQVKKKNSGGEDWSGDDQGHGGNTHSLELWSSTTINEESFHELSLGSPSNSTVSFNSLLGGTDSGTNYNSSSSSSSSSSSAGCFSGNITEEDDDEGDDGCLDDWETIADALAADDQSLSPQHDSDEPVGRKDLTLDNPKMVSQISPPKVNPRAWSPDDAFRPQTLPSLSKNHSFPNSGRHYANEEITCGNRNSDLTVPISCPICCEDLDLTDSSFMPCLCGFRLCLFCHNRILEQACRCPGCRKPYEQDRVEWEATVQEGNLEFRLTRSYSMMARP